MVTASQTFDFQVNSVIGYKIEQKGEIDYVSEVWCKICAANKGKLYQHHAVKGATRIAVERFVNETNFITKNFLFYLYM